MRENIFIALCVIGAIVLVELIFVLALYVAIR